MNKQSVALLLSLYRHPEAWIGALPIDIRRKLAAMSNEDRTQAMLNLLDVHIEPEPVIPQYESPVGIVYVITYAEIPGLYKIGKSSDFKARMNSFKTATPFEAVIVCVIETAHPSRLESQLHSKFAEKRHNREWFKLDDSDIEYLKSLSHPTTGADHDR